MTDTADESIEYSIEISRQSHLGLVTSSELDSWSAGLEPPKKLAITGDARHIDLPDSAVDLVMTSPPYWQKRDYGHEGQIGLEPTPTAYVAAMMDCLREWRR